MSQVSKELLGLTLDEGAGFFVKESAHAESGSASISHVLLETTKFIGAQTRTEYVMPQMTQMNWALRAFENRIPECQLLFDQAMENPSPKEAVALFDELIQMAVGSAAAPCLRIIPGTAILQNAYGSAQSMQDSLYGKYHYDGYISQKGLVDVAPKQITARALDAIAMQMAVDWEPLLGAQDLEVLSHLISVIRLWQRSALGDIGDELSQKDIRSLLSGMSIYTKLPNWANVPMDIDDSTGEILINGQPLTDESLIAAAVPTGALGEVTVRKGSKTVIKQLAERIASHNKAMQSKFQYKDIKKVDPWPDGEFVVRTPDGRTQTAIIPPNPVAGEYVVYSLTFGKPERTEYMVFHLKDHKKNVLMTATQARSLAYATWKQFHSGLPNLHGSGVRSAEKWVMRRNELASRVSLVPAVREALARIRDKLSHCTHRKVQSLVSTLNGVENSQSAQDIEDFVARADDIISDPQDGMLRDMPKLADIHDQTPLDAAQAAGFTVIGAGRYAPTETTCVAMVPVKGRGAAPVLMERNGKTLDAKKALNVAVVLEEPPATVYSPVKTMMATALLRRLLQYMNGHNTPPGYNFDEFDEYNAYGLGQTRPCPRTLLLRQIDRYEQALVHVIDNMTVDQVPDLLKSVQKLVDAKYFLNHIEDVIDSIINREDWIYMLQSMIVSLLVHDGAQILDSDKDNVVSVDAGVVPRRAAEFLFGTVLADIRTLDSYDNAVTAAMNYGLTAPPAIREAANLARVTEAEVLFARAVNGLELLKSLMDGSNPLITNVHVGSIQHLIDVDLTNELMEAITMVFNRDYLGLVDKIEFEAPWDCAEWTTSFGAFAFSVRTAPIMYQAVDVARECAVDSKLASVTSALARVGFEWSEIAPADLRVRGADQSSFTIGPAMPMAGQCGTDGYYNDAPIAHQCLKITTVVPSYDIEAYNLVKAYLTMHTSRTYFGQPVGKDISDRYTIRLPIGTKDPVLDMVLNCDNAGQNRRQTLNGNGMEIEKTPALANVAIIMPYVANYLQKPAITRDVSVPQIIQIDSERSLAQVSGVSIVRDTASPALLSPSNGLAITVTEKRSVSTALPWIGS